MSNIKEIAPDIFRISVYVSASGLQFNQFLIRDEQPVLYHTGDRALFPEVLAAVNSLLDTSSLRWIGFSHFEGDECGSLNQWLALASQAVPITGVVAAATSINSYSDRTPRVLEDNATITTGRHTLRFLVTPHIPHNWESSLLYDESERVLFCSDLLLQRGDRPPTADDVLERAVDDLEKAQRGPFHDSIPYTHATSRILARLAELHPETLAVMHGASFRGDGASVLQKFDRALNRLFGTPTRSR
ncbi:MAG: MBL fold metallo-hydrolase [Acetobacteraceae bacterium]